MIIILLEGVNSLTLEFYKTDKGDYIVKDISNKKEFKISEYFKDKEEYLNVILNFCKEKGYIKEDLEDLKYDGKIKALEGVIYDFLSVNAEPVDILLNNEKVLRFNKEEE